MPVVTARMGHRRARPRHSAGIWFATGLIAAFVTAFVISLGLSRDDRAAGAPASSALGPAPPLALPLPPAGLQAVAPMPDLQRTVKRPAAVQAAPARAVATTAPTVTPTPTQEAIPEAPAPAPTPAPRDTPTTTPTVGQEFDSSG
jgi:hypothetical protein